MFRPARWLREVGRELFRYQHPPLSPALWLRRSTVRHCHNPAASPPFAPEAAHTCSRRAESSLGWLVLAPTEPAPEAAGCSPELLAPLPALPVSSPVRAVPEIARLGPAPGPTLLEKDAGRSRRAIGLS